MPCIKEIVSLPIIIIIRIKAAFATPTRNTNITELFTEANPASLHCL
jgi:hypothetical protein